MVAYLTDELIQQGHEVTLFASGDSMTKGRLIAPCERSLRLNPDCDDPLAYHYLQLEQVRAHATSFDIIHFHVDFLHFPFSRHLAVPHVTTFHGRLDLPALMRLYRQFPRVPVVSISDSQREPVPFMNWHGTVYHGLPLDLYEAKKEAGKYLAFIGRIAPEKRLDRAIEIAKRANMKLKIAAKIDPADRGYMKREIRKLLNHPLIEYIGEIGEEEKQHFLADAYALLFPIDWAEPFGMVMIEAMACGTPTVAFRRGSVPEVIDDGISGFVVDNIAESLAVLATLKNFDRARCRQIFEARFSARRMAADYLQIYERLVRKRSQARLAPRRSSISISVSSDHQDSANGTACVAKSKNSE